MKSWLPTIVRPGHHPGLPHSPSTKPSQSREVRFDKVVTKLLGLPGLIKPNMRPVQIKACPSRSKMMRSLINTGEGYHLETSEYPWIAPHPSFLSAPLSPICPAPSQNPTRTSTSTHHSQDNLLVYKREVLYVCGTYIQLLPKSIN
jgi:hypothetical protein